MAQLEVRQHIQNHSEALYSEPHWGYVERSLPCTNDPGSCEYLDAVYWMHDISMLYNFILWAVLGGLIVVCTTLHLIRPSRRVRNAFKEVEGQRQLAPQSLLYRIDQTTKAYIRKYLLPESLRSVFGHVTRLQVLILGILLAYLLVFSLVGIVYKTWITPVKNSDKYNTRTGLGGFSDRVGALAYALTPLTILLSTRESLLTLLTGISYQHFNFLHRWTGRIIFVQSFLHAIGWTIIEGKLYQPQPTVYRNFIRQEYMIWGCVALLLISFLFVSSLRSVIRITGYEFFRITHILIAVVYLGACWAHWAALSCWMIPGLALFFIDRGIRLMRVGLLHVGYLNDGSFGFSPANAKLTYFDDPSGRVVRIDYEHNQEAWTPGQHFFLCFPELSVWQSHPFTVASIPAPHPALPHHTYIVRCLKGETSKLGALAQKKAATNATTPVIMTGPYGTEIVSVSTVANVLAIAGGTGISLALPIALDSLTKTTGTVQLIWSVRRAADLQWMAPEIEKLRQMASRADSRLKIRIYITRESKQHGSMSAEEKSMDEKTGCEVGCSAVSALGSSSEPSILLEEQRGFEVFWLSSTHPVMDVVVSEFVDSLADGSGNVKIVASGPASMGMDLRTAVAKVNNPSEVWKGCERGDVDFHWDDRAGG